MNFFGFNNVRFIGENCVINLICSFVMFAIGVAFHASSLSEGILVLSGLKPTGRLPDAGLSSPSAVNTLRQFPDGKFCPRVTTFPDLVSVPGFLTRPNFSASQLGR